MADIIAETERLILRTIEESDAALQDHPLNTPNVMERLGGVKELHEIEAKHAKSMQLYAREGFSFLFMIEGDWRDGWPLRAKAGGQSTCQKCG